MDEQTANELFGTFGGENILAGRWADIRGTDLWDALLERTRAEEKQPHMDGGVGMCCHRLWTSDGFRRCDRPRWMRHNVHMSSGLEWGWWWITATDDGYPMTKVVER